MDMIANAVAGGRHPRGPAADLAGPRAPVDLDAGARGAWQVARGDSARRPWAAARWSAAEMRLSMFSILSVALALGLSVPNGAALSQPPPPRQERVTFPHGASSATITGTLKGDLTVDYLVRAGAGQTMTVSLTPTNRLAYFNVLPPGTGDVAMHVAQTGEPFRGRLPADGDYRVRVYLVRAAARRNETSRFTLTIGVTGTALAPLPGTSDALVPGTGFHAQAQIMCVANPYVDDKTPKPCNAFVTRRGTNGTATVEVDLGAAGRRRILFEQGSPVVSDASEPMKAIRQGDVTLVTFGLGERHEIPDAFVIGG